jgi:hypothetical protein
VIFYILGEKFSTTSQPSRLNKYLLILSWSNLSVEERFHKRKENVLSSCRTFQQPLTETEKNELYRNLIVDDKHRILYCRVPKACSTSWRTVLLVTAGIVGTIEEVRSQDRTGREHRLHKYSSQGRDYRLNNYIRFMVAREPLTRLVSSFQTHVLKSDKKLWRWEINAALKTSKGREPREGINNISIEEFADYVIDSGSTNLQLTMNSHWRPVNLLCRPCHVSYDYYSWAETAKEDADYLFQKFGFPPSVHFPYHS